MNQLGEGNGSIQLTRDGCKKRNVGWQNREKNVWAVWCLSKKLIVGGKAARNGSKRIGFIFGVKHRRQRGKTKGGRGPLIVGCDP